MPAVVRPDRTAAVDNVGVGSRRAPAAAEEGGRHRGDRLPFATVAVGTSAGGVDALLRLFGALPPVTGCAFVVVIHLSPDRDSALTALLLGATLLSRRPSWPAGGSATCSSPMMWRNSSRLCSACVRRRRSARRWSGSPSAAAGRAGSRPLRCRAATTPAPPVSSARWSISMPRSRPSRRCARPRAARTSSWRCWATSCAIR